MSKDLKITERGWAGHFCGCRNCLFRRNTLVEYKDEKIVVSTVGLYNPHNEFVTLTIDGAYYETKCFEAKYNDKYFDANVSKEIAVSNKHYINEIDAEIEANAMHDNMVKEISERLLTDKIEYLK